MGGFILRSSNKDMVLWEQRIKARTESGLSVTEWCKLNEIKKNRYYYWYNKISNTEATNEEVEFAEITSTISDEHEVTANQYESADFQIFFKNMQVTVPNNFSEESLAGLMKVLQQL